MYKIIGADQREYGPVTADQIRQWIREGRANGASLARLEEGPWKALSTFPEFAADLSATIPSVAASAPPPTYMVAGAPKTNGMAIAGLIFSVLGFVCCGPVGFSLGLIFSIIGLAQIKEKPDLYTGKALAIAGIIIGIIGFCLLAFAVATGTVGRILRELNMRRW